MKRAADDRRWMRLALTLGARGLGRVAPNPAVGCVLIKDGRVVGRGWTQPGGRPHAERVALDMAGADARGSTAYVTLEPCSHEGKTGPCSVALIEAGVDRVVVATSDPDARVNGKGIAMLRNVGIEVVEDVCEAEAQQAHEGFFRKVRDRRPLLTLKLATSIDGRIATGSGHSQWITGEQARLHVHLLRARHDAVLVGAGTVRDDAPSLTVRGLGMAHNPVRLVISSRLDLPQSGPLADTAREIPVWILHGTGASAERVAFWKDIGARCIAVPVVEGGQVDVGAAMGVCADGGLTRVLCEGGGQLAASLLQAGCVDRFVQFIGGVSIGAEGRPSLGALGLADLSEAEAFRLTEIADIEGDAHLIWDRLDA